MKALTSTLQRIGTAPKHWRRHSWAAYRQRLQRSKLPVLVGPWRSELGFEALYWIPFVQALGLDPERVIPITRGGAGDFYRVPQSLELFSLREPQDVRIENIQQFHQHKTLKQLWMTDFDRAILKDAAAKLGLRRYLVLHPAWMYQVLTPFWESRMGVDWAWTHLLRTRQTDGKPEERILDPIPTLPLPEGVTLPKDFVAARFYLRSTFPHHELTVTAARAAIQQVAHQQPVILLNSGIHADEHMDIDLRGVPNVLHLSDLVPLTPQNNLAIQAAVIARAHGFMGTYGGLAQLALRLGRPSVSFYLEWEGTALAHKHLADAMATIMRVSTLVLKVTEIPLLRSVLPHVQMAAASSSGARVA